MNVEPSYYGLSSKITLIELAGNKIGIEKRMKSRIIQKDALKIIEMVRAIKEKDPHLKVSLICNNNICSKSKNLLAENNIEIIH